MANGLPKPKCGWPEPADQWNINGDVPRLGVLLMSLTITPEGDTR